MLAALALLAIASAPVPSCAGERVIVMPFEPLATTPAEAREVEEKARAVIAATGRCVEERAHTIARLRARPPLPPCAEDACHAAQASAMGGQWLVNGVVLGVGGARSLSIVVAGKRVARKTMRVEGANLSAIVHELFSDGEKSFAAVDVRQSAERARWPAFAVAGAGAASVLAGALFGAASARASSELSSGATGCAGVGEAYRDCFDAKIRTGRSHATMANVLLGAGAALGVGAAVMFVWELP